MFQRVLASRQVALIAGLSKPGGVVKLSGTWGSSAPLLAAAVGIRNRRPVLVICSHLDDADQIADDIEVLSGASAEIFPAWELSGAEPAGEEALPIVHGDDETTGERLRLCRLLLDSAQARAGKAVHERVGKVGKESDLTHPTEEAPPQFIVAPILALMQPVPTPQVLTAAKLSLQVGASIDPEELTRWLVDAGFDRVEAVDQQGEFARRGGIVDIFTPGTLQPVRVEFFGDQIDSIRYFDLDTQRSTQAVKEYSLVATSAGRSTDPAATTHLLEYLPPEALAVIIEPVEVTSLAQTFYRRLEGMRPATPEAPAANTSPPRVHRVEGILAAAQRLAVIEMSTFGPTRSEDAAPQTGVQAESAERSPYGRDTVHVGIRSIQRLEVNTAEALDELEKLSKDNQVWVYCENQAERDRFVELIGSSHPQLAARVKTAIGHLARGFHWPELHLAVVGHHEIFHRYVRPRRLRRIRTGRPIDSFVDLEEGDYVVHVAHGIAKFDGLRTLAKDGRKEEYLTLRFADNALLHVPVTQINLVQKYIGAGKGHPTLSHLGGVAWQQRKARVAQAVHDMAAELLRVQAVRASAPGISYAGTSDWLNKFEEEFVYNETEDQLAAMQQIFVDMAAPRPMDRLLCGDVGYGKTELAMRAAFKVVEAGKQAAVLVPTTVLADQHYRTFTERFADYPFVVDVISRFRSKKEQQEIVQRARAGQIDILIGTHRLLSADVQFADLGLVIIDEEQRFGVEHKERLKRMRETVDVLTMTATPIPRTLHMTLLGLRDISNLTTPPLDRRAIYTEVSQVNDERIKAAMLRELNRDGQVFFVHNRVQNIESVAEHVRSILPEARVAVGHGQMPERMLEKTMLRFVRGDIDVLVCTTIIESGLDIPTANTMFIHESDRLGLAQLHQLRGRIGRYKHRAYCYLLLPQRRPVSRIAAKRLKAVEEFSDLGAGFQIAMRDLEIRGAGNILGAEQSGHIAAVGYEMYCRLLEQSVRQLRGEKVPTPPDAHLELGMEAFIPRSYVESPRQRMEVYRRMALCQSVPALRQLEKDLHDAYGPVPKIVQTLLELAEIRVLAGELGFSHIILNPPDIVFTIADTGKAKNALAGAAGSVRMPDDRTAYWRPPPPYLQPASLLTVLRKQLQRPAHSR